MKKKKNKFKLTLSQIENLKYLRLQLIEAEKKINIKEINTCKALLDKCLDEIIKG